MMFRAVWSLFAWCISGMLVQQVILNNTDLKRVLWRILLWRNKGCSFQDWWQEWWNLLLWLVLNLLFQRQAIYGNSLQSRMSLLPVNRFDWGWSFAFHKILQNFTFKIGFQTLQRLFRFYRTLVIFTGPNLAKVVQPHLINKTEKSHVFYNQLNKELEHLFTSRYIPKRLQIHCSLNISRCFGSRWCYHVVNETVL